MSNIYTGYSGIIWQTVYKAMQYYSEQLAILLATQSGTTNSAQMYQLSSGMLATLLNGVQAINANTLANAWTLEHDNLQTIQGLPISIDNATRTIFNARVSAYEAALPSLQALIPQPPYENSGVISSGQSVIPTTNLLDYFEAFEFETPPNDLTQDSFIGQTAAVATAMQTVATAILALQGDAGLTQSYDTAQLEQYGATLATDIIQDFTSGPGTYSLQSAIGYFAIGESPLGEEFSSGPLTFSLESAIGYFVIGVSPIGEGFTATWNQIVSLPAMAAVGSVLANAPYLQINQQQQAIRNAMLNLAAQIETLILSLRQPLSSQVNLTRLRVGESSHGCRCQNHREL